MEWIFVSDQLVLWGRCGVLQQKYIEGSLLTISEGVMGSNIAVKNVLQVYVSITMIFYAISSQKVRLQITDTYATVTSNGLISSIGLLIE